MVPLLTLPELNVFPDGTESSRMLTSGRDVVILRRQAKPKSQ